VLGAGTRFAVPASSTTAITNGQTGCGIIAIHHGGKSWLWSFVATAGNPKVGVIAGTVLSGWSLTWSGNKLSITNPEEQDFAATYIGHGFGIVDSLIY
jgi:hypothetical protein